MSRNTLAMLCLLAAAGSPSYAGTFEETPISADLDVQVFTKDVARQQVGRDLLADPYDAVVIGNVDVYDVFPYLEARYFQVVSDPGWNRLVFGQKDAGFYAFDGAGTSFGHLDAPHGMSVDGSNRVYVADTGNDRILVLKAVTEFDEIALVPLYTVDGLKRPHDVAYSDAGTPHDTADDRLYVADTGRNRVVAFTLEGTSAVEVASVGELGSGQGRFAGPMAITIGRTDGVANGQVYVADAHTRRIVQLRDTGSSLQWMQERVHDADIVTSLDTDHWGNIYTAAPNAGVVCKYSPTLSRLAEVEQHVTRPRSFHVPFVTVTDHRSGTSVRSGQPQGVLVEEWTSSSGVSGWNLGVEARDLAVRSDDGVGASFTLTDHADVSVELTEVATGHVVARRAMGGLESGAHAVVLESGDYEADAPAGEYTLRVRAASRYEDGDADVAEARFYMADGGPQVAPTQPMLIGNHPNPFRPATRIGFLVPEGDHAPALVKIFDAQGRLVRSLTSSPLVTGFNEIPWDGTDGIGELAPAGAYFYRLEVGGESFTDKMILVR